MVGCPIYNCLENMDKYKELLKKVATEIKNE